MRLGIPRSEQGQIVEYSYGWFGGDYYMRIYDRSDRTETWYRATARSARHLAETSYEAGGETYPPPVAWCKRPVPPPTATTED